MTRNGKRHQHKPAQAPQPFEPRVLTVRQSIEERGLLLTLFPNPLFYPWGQRKLAAFIYVLHLVIAIVFLVILIGLYAYVFAGVDSDSYVKIATIALWLFGTMMPILLLIYNGSNVASKYVGGDGGTVLPDGTYMPPAIGPNGQQGTINIKVGGAQDGQELPPLPVTGGDK